jgi:hypothetical protein
MYNYLALMNRRLFLLNPLITINSPTITKPKQYNVSMKTNNDNYCFFSSKNEKFRSHIIYQDLEDSVLMNTVIEWDDPLTEITLQKKSSEFFILDKYFG